MTQPLVQWVFPDVQVLLVGALGVWVGEDNVDTETPEDLQDNLPFIRVERLGGGRDQLSDAPSIEVQVYASTYAEASRLAEHICQWLCGPPPPLPQIDKATCTSAPVEIPYGDVRIRRLVASYQLTTRRVRAS